MNITQDFAQRLSGNLDAYHVKDEFKTLPDPLRDAVADLKGALAGFSADSPESVAAADEALKAAVLRGALARPQGIQPQDFAVNAVSNALHEAAESSGFDLTQWCRDHDALPSFTLKATARELVSTLVRSGFWEARPGGRARAVFKTANHPQNIPPGLDQDALCEEMARLLREKGAHVDTLGQHRFMEITASKEANGKIQEAFAGHGRQRGG